MKASKKATWRVLHRTGRAWWLNALLPGEGESGGIKLVDEPLSEAPRGPGAPLLELAGVSLRTPGGGRGLVDGLDLRVRCPPTLTLRSVGMVISRSQRSQQHTSM